MVDRAGEEGVAVSSSRRSWVASALGVVSAVTALSCCLPLGFLAALGVTGTSFFLPSFQPWLLGLSVAFLGVGFFQQYRKTGCPAKRSRLSEVLLWISAFLILVMILFPEVVAGLIANAMRWGER